MSLAHDSPTRVSTRIEPGIYNLSPADAGGWIIEDLNGANPFPGQRFGSQKAAVQFMTVRANANGQLIHYIPDDEGEIEGFIIEDRRPHAQLTLALSPAAAGAVDQILAETGDSPGEMVRKAMGLYKLALDARKRGKVVGAADSPDVLETEFTGF